MCMMLTYKRGTSYLHDIISNGYIFLIMFHIGFAFVRLIILLSMIAANIFIFLNAIEEIRFRHSILVFELLMYGAVGLTSAICPKPKFAIYTKRVHKYLSIMLALTGSALSFFQFYKLLGLPAKIVQFLTTAAACGILLLIYLDYLSRRGFGRLIEDN